jgi:hypothetical protein
MRAEINPGSKIFGYFESEQLRVTEWKGGYPNPAFERATLRDLSWMARIIARFTPEHLAAAVAQARVQRPARRALAHRDAARAATAHLRGGVHQVEPAG